MKQARLTDGDWTASATESQSAPVRGDESKASEASSESYLETKAALCDRAAAHANEVAAEHFPELPVEAIDWETSTRMQRSAGVAIYERQSEQITIRLSWDAYKAYGWEQFSRVIRHELIHAWQYHKYDEADHGSTFRQWIESLKTDRHCEGYAESNYWVICKACESRDPRYRRSKVVKQPEKYSCDDVGVRF